MMVRPTSDLDCQLLNPSTLVQYSVYFCVYFKAFTTKMHYIMNCLLYVVFACKNLNFFASMGDPLPENFMQKTKTHSKFR